MSRRNPDAIKLSYTPDSIWRNRDKFIRGRDEIVEFLTKKWKKEKGYRLRKELFAFTDNKVRLPPPPPPFHSLPLPFPLSRTELLRLTPHTSSPLIVITDTP